MEKSSGIKSKNRLLKLASSAVSFQNPPFSPNREKAQARKGFSGPMIPVEARYKSKNSSYVTHEPTSPEVSCMGQIKHKKKLRDLQKHKKKTTTTTSNNNNNNNNNVLHNVDHSNSYSTPKVNRKTRVFKSFQSFSDVKKKKNPPVLSSVQSFNDHEETTKKKKSSAIRNLFGKAAARSDRYEPAAADKSKTAAPSLGQLQRFSSGRNSLSNFDWTTAEISPAVNDRRSDDESEDDEWDEEDVKISFSAPLGINLSRDYNQVNNSNGIIEPRKEINLWKRRTMAQPKPLQLNS